MNFEVGQKVELAYSDFHHIVNVFRGRGGDLILLLNGRGQSAVSKLQLEKKRGHVEIKSTEHKEIPSRSITLILGIPKKDALQECLRIACELGILEVLLIQSDYSQKINPDRISQFLKQGIEQSNQVFCPQVKIYQSFNEVNFSKFNYVYLMDSKSKSREAGPGGQSQAIIIGPEGGFSESEYHFLQNHPQGIIGIHLSEVAIMRTPTAVSYSFGKLRF
jgi:16S rRNA (uracil1498-N3)-methyltransferase